MPVIETRGLTKHYGQLCAVNALNLNIEKGEIYGFLGLNGAGKTTTMRMLLGMIAPTAGEASLFGKPVKQRSEVWAKVGYMLESSAYPDLTVEQNLKVFYQYRGLNDKDAIDRVIVQLKLQRYRNVKAKLLSLGNRQRLGLAKVLMHQPELLILDEPSNGLDPSGIVEIRQLLEELSSEGVTILVSSHILSEVSKIADTIGIIHQGSLIKELKAMSLHEQLHRKLIVNTDNNDLAASLLDDHGMSVQVNEIGELELADNKAMADPGSVASLLVYGQLSVKKLLPFEEDLESFFLRTINQGAI